MSTRTTHQDDAHLIAAAPRREQASTSGPRTGTVRSSDGTTIAYRAAGAGPTVILVDGALCFRGMGPTEKLASRLEAHCRVVTYDRRGRGTSGDAPDYAVEREIEDLAALIEAHGGSASLVGFSSGAALALEATAAGLAVERLALYEAPFIVDDSRAPMTDAQVARLDELVAADRRAAAVKLFMRFVGVPAPMLAVMPLMPVWSSCKSVAHTLPYDFAIVAEHQVGAPLPVGRWAGAQAPTLVYVGGKSPAWMQNAQRALVENLPQARLRTLPGQTHMVKPKVMEPEIVAFLADRLP